MKIVDKIIDFFYEKKIKTMNFAEVKEISKDYWHAAVYTKLPFMKRYCVWSTYGKTVSEANDKMMKAIESKTIVKDEVSLVTYIDQLWWNMQQGWLNFVDIIKDDGDVIKKAKGVFKKPVKKWYWGFGIKKSVFKPFDSDCINPILYINSWSLGWKPKYDYVCFEDNPQVWFCLFKFFWFGYNLVSPVDEDHEDGYWEQMIWYVNYCDCDLKKAEETWYEEWKKEYLIGDE